MTAVIPPASFIFESAAHTCVIIVVILSGKLHATVNRTKKAIAINQPMIRSMLRWDQHTQKSESLECNAMFVT